MTASTPPGTSASLFIASVAEPAVSTLKPASCEILRRQHLYERLVLDEQNASGRLARVDDVSEFGRERGLRVRLGYQFHARVEPAVMDDGIARIGGRKQYP